MHRHWHHEEDFENPNVVKIVCADNGDALYFSRAPIPHPRDGDIKQAMNAALHHHGIYAYCCGVLKQLVKAPPSELEQAEKLEQLRAQSIGMRIRVAVPAQRPGRGVDSEEDLLLVAKELQGVADL